MASLSSQTIDVGRMEMRVGTERPDGSYTIQNIPLEAYVARVLVGEAAPNSPPAALESLAIAIRTYAIVNRNRHNADGFDVCDTTHCQVLRIATTATERAANATAGLVLMRAGAPVPVYYSASCGGRTEVPSAVWPGSDDPPYLPSQPDDACEGQPEWAANISLADLSKSFKAAGFRGDRLRGMRVVSRNRSGRVSKLQLTGLTPDTITGQDLRAVVGRTLGWLLVKSAAFEMDRRGDVYHFEGHGYGHGVGMCVIGAFNLATRGQTAPQILNRYYPGLDIVPFANAATVITSSAKTLVERDGAKTLVERAPETRSAEAFALRSERAPDPLETFAMESAGDIAKALGVSPPARVALRIHPTTQSYETTTGQAWFTSGSVVNGEIHLLPVAVLRDRGILERTIRHELVHLLVDEPLATRPAWVREGAALYFSGQRPGASEEESRFKPRGRLSCPDDAELVQPVSAGSLSNAHARALACFARQAGDGRPWRDVK